MDRMASFIDDDNICERAADVGADCNMLGFRHKSPFGQFWIELKLARQDRDPVVTRHDRRASFEEVAQIDPERGDCGQLGHEPILQIAAFDIFLCGEQIIKRSREQPER